MNTRTLALDRAAVCISGLCLFHCLALPMLVAFLPALSAAAEAEWLHRVFVLFALPVSIGAIVGSSAILPARARAVFSVAVLTGLLLLILGAFVEALHDWEVTITTAGALVLAGAHLWRWKTLRSMRNASFRVPDRFA